MSMDTLFDLEDNLLLFFTGFTRSAARILRTSRRARRRSDAEMLRNLHYVKAARARSRGAGVAATWRASAS